MPLGYILEGPTSKASRVRMNSKGYRKVVVVPPANPPDKNADTIARLFFLVSFERFEGNASVEFMIGEKIAL